MLEVENIEKPPEKQEVQLEQQLPLPIKRSGKTREHYLTQKNQQFAHFRINKADLPKLEGMQFNIYDFITASFAFSQPKKELAIGVLNTLKSGSKPFAVIGKELNAKKSTLFLVCLSLERGGLIERNGKGEPYKLSTEFSSILSAYASWWKFWVEH
ncbi:MAG: hypothetical protein V1722_02805 [Candidatus Micrarchaeota archaeon]